jgi:hypothetical protein
MNRDQIIAKTLVDMGVDETTFEISDSEDADGYPPYIRDVFFPEMLKRLPEGDIITCDDVKGGTECCSICHRAYPHYEMDVVELPKGGTGWICCAVRRALFPEEATAYDSSAALDLTRMLGGDKPNEQGE